MMAVVQLSFFFLLTQKNLNPSLSALTQLKWINGYNSLFSASIADDPYVPYQPKGILMFSQFGYNFNITIVLVLLPLLSGLIVLLLYKVAFKEKKILKTIYRGLIGEYTLMGLMLIAYVVWCSTAI